MGLLEELKIIQEVIDETKQTIPHFELMLVITGLKIVGHSHIGKMIEHIQIGKKAYPNLIAGFDMVNEEEFTPGIADFMPQILAAQNDKDSSTYQMPTFCHAGETHDKNITNLHDAILLNTKRVGHGFQLFLFPNLVQEYINKDICIEVCPLSNMVLGYTLDLRTHPIRDLMYGGLQFSISSDDPCFFDYKGVTLDYAYATLAWELNIRDLKKISLNGITYSSIDQKKKDHLLKSVFPAKWADFIAYVNSL